MPELEFAPLGEDEFPLPFGIDAKTGQALPSKFAGAAELDDAKVSGAGEPGALDHLAIADIDPENLEEAGWCVVFAKGTPATVKKALQPLLDQREREAKRLFKVFDDASAVSADDLALAWVEKHGAGFQVVDPDRGIPLYVLLVGPPSGISFEFQYLLDLYWSVGRLDFDTPEEYRDYAERVVAYETAAAVPTRKKALLFCAKNKGDRATGLLHNQVVKPMLDGTPVVRTLRGFRGFEVEGLLAAEASKARLAGALAGQDGGRPALLFTGSHGIRVGDDEVRAREENGALVCQDRPGFGETLPEHLFRAADLAPELDLSGVIHYLFACYGAGCPAVDNFDAMPDGSAVPLLPQPIVSRLAQAMLRRGALAVLGHVDRAWTYSFQNTRSVAQVQEMRNVMVRLMKGERLGRALEDFNKRWAILSAELQETQALVNAGIAAAKPAGIANRWVARNDARNYIVVGDPAVRLRVNDMP